MTDRRQAVNRLSPLRFVVVSGSSPEWAWRSRWCCGWLPGDSPTAPDGTGGGTVLGALYDYSIPALSTFTVITQALALVLCVPLLHHR